MGPGTRELGYQIVAAIGTFCSDRYIAYLPIHGRSSVVILAIPRVCFQTENEPTFPTFCELPEPLRTYDVTFAAALARSFDANCISDSNGKNGSESGEYMFKLHIRSRRGESTFIALRSGPHL